MAEAKWMMSWLAVAVVVAPVWSATAAEAEQLPPEMLEQMDACLLDGIEERDVLNTSVVCFNAAHQGCGADVLACEEALTTALAARGDTLVGRLPSELEGVPEFAKENYLEIRGEIEAGSVAYCADVPKDQAVSCGYRAQALRLAKLRALGASLDPRFLLP
ncbi:hypothetical protein CLV78_101574 [Aliiruegeria haliotis]|uniref:Uncharacterized protein n=1 Tax=Aliiruegeria haliotis TaxID=1280846 RepID=A0A2T0RZ84_9RHOB|nr:hypothetical protein [Aliiruegeria haliotis]PRY26478.1 hypothetical protein CLV78_101574 [Aliiruegeria haliotis]